jgi:uncharacterized protein (DUF3820 family)
MNDFKLKFGKYKGQMFKSTPIDYQKWLVEQDWFYEYYGFYLEKGESINIFNSSNDIKLLDNIKKTMNIINKFK